MLSWSWVKRLEDQFDEAHRYRLTEVMRIAHDRDGDVDMKPVQPGVALGDLSTLRIDGTEEQGISAGHKERQLEASTGTTLPRLPIFAL